MFALTDFKLNHFFLHVNIITSSLQVYMKQLFLKVLKTAFQLNNFRYYALYTHLQMHHVLFDLNNQYFYHDMINNIIEILKNNDLQSAVSYE